MAKNAAAVSTDATHKKPRREITLATMEAALKKANGYVTIAAQLIDCDPSTIHRRIKTSPVLQSLMSDLDDRRLDTAELALDRAIQDREGWAVCFFLKTKGKKRGYVERIEQTGADGGALKVQVVYGDDPARIESEDADADDRA
jgi:hypothetical protein